MADAVLSAAVTVDDLGTKEYNVPLITKRKIFLLTATDADILSGDKELGNLGRGYWKVCANSDQADGSLTVNDGSSNILDGVTVPKTATAGVLDRDNQVSWVFYFNGAGSAPKIGYTESTAATAAILIEYMGVGG